jgi:hypothetical protein
MYQTNFPSSFSQIDAIDSRLGRRSDVVMWYAQWVDGGNSGLARWDENAPYIDQVHARGQIPMITWEDWGDGQSFPLSAIAAGKFDAYIDSWAQGAASRKFPIWLRIFHEFNDNSEYPWQITKNSTQDFIAAWRHVHDRFTAAGATQVRWIWNPDGPGINEAQIRSAYPGDQYVDLTGLDTYGYNDVADYAAVAAVSHKPMVLGEIGARGAGQAGWLSRLSDSINGGSMPLVRGVIYFDEKSWALEASPQLLDVAMRMVRGPAFKLPVPVSPPATVPPVTVTATPSSPASVVVPGVTPAVQPSPMPTVELGPIEDLGVTIPLAQG